MIRKSMLTSAIVLSVPVLASAQPVTGLYVGAGAGGNFMQSESIHNRFHENAYTVGSGANAFTEPAFDFAGSSSASYDPGAVAVGSVGYGLGNGLRLEGEGNFRYNPASNSFGHSQRKYGAMANALFDFNVGSPDIFPYAGLGAGYEWVDRGYHGGYTNSFGYQAILGVATPVKWVPGLAFTLEYRFMGVVGTNRTSIGPAAGPSAGSVQLVNRTSFDDNFNHGILLGVRYAFNTPKPAVVEPPPSPPPAPAQARSYLVFFDWDRADLTDRARQIIAEAALARTRVAATRIEVQGNADRTGTAAYNQTLSLHRAQTVAAELVRDGVPGTAIDIQAFGDTRPLVATAAGVREPQNRRVAIILQ